MFQSQYKFVCEAILKVFHGEYDWHFWGEKNVYVAVTFAIVIAV